MEGLLRVAFGVDIPRSQDDILHDVVDEALDEEVEPFDMYGDQFSSEQFYDSANSPLDDEEKVKYQRPLEVSNNALPDCCTTFSKLSFLLHLFHMKGMLNWSAKCFTMLMKRL